MPALGVVSSRDKLKVQPEPHWLKISSGCSLGLRKLTAMSTGNWLARYRDENGVQHKRSLGEFSDKVPPGRFDAAKNAAQDWFEHLGKGGSAKSVTVGGACQLYAAHVRGHRGDAPADDLHMRFKRWVYCDRKFADLQPDKLTKTRVEAWRLVMTKTPAKISRDKRAVPVARPRAASSVNRDMAALRAALNFAHDAGSVTTDMAWRVALRPGDLAALNVGSFDVRREVLTVGKDKAGHDRRIKLPATTAALFKAQCKDKLQTGPLFCRQDGKARNKDTWKGPIKAAAASAQLPIAVTAYTLRHSVITDLVTAGLDLLTVAQLSGTSVAMIERHCGHLRADHAAAALATLAL
jgi:integrase